MFDKELFLQLAKDMDMKVSFSGVKDTVNDKKVGVMKITFEPFKKNREAGDDNWIMKTNRKEH